MGIGMPHSSTGGMHQVRRGEPVTLAMFLRDDQGHAVSASSELEYRISRDGALFTQLDHAPLMQHDGVVQVELTAEETYAEIIMLRVGARGQVMNTMVVHTVAEPASPSPALQVGEPGETSTELPIPSLSVWIHNHREVQVPVASAESYTRHPGHEYPTPSQTGYSWSSWLIPVVSDS